MHKKKKKKKKNLERKRKRKQMELNELNHGSFKHSHSDIHWYLYKGGNVFAMKSCGNTLTTIVNAQLSITTYWQLTQRAATDQ